MALYFPTKVIKGVNRKHGTNIMANKEARCG